MKTGELTRDELRLLSKVIVNYNKNLKVATQELVVYEVGSKLHLWIGFENSILFEM